MIRAKLERTFLKKNAVTFVVIYYFYFISTLFYLKQTFEFFRWWMLHLNKHFQIINYKHYWFFIRTVANILKGVCSSDRLSSSAIQQILFIYLLIFLEILNCFIQLTDVIKISSNYRNGLDLIILLMQNFRDFIINWN